MTETYYFVPVAQQSHADPQLFQVRGKKIDVTESVTPLVAAAVVGHLRELAFSKSFDTRARRKILAAARQVEKNVGIEIDATSHER